MTRALALLALLPWLWAVATQWRYHVDVPYWDQWELVGSLGHVPSFGELFALHNEHRLLVPRASMLALAAASGWDTRWELAANALLAAAGYLVVLRQARRTTAGLAPGGAHLPVALALLLFSLCAWENWLWGWQLQVFLCALGVAGACSLLAAPSLDARRLAAAALLAALASYSFGSGLVVWPVGALLLAAREEPGRGRRVGAWLAAAAVALGVYAVGLKVVPLGGERELLKVGAYVQVYVGAPLAPTNSWGALAAGGVAIVGAPLLASHLLRAGRLTRLELLPWAGMLAFTLGAAALTAWGRAGLGVNQARASRYTTLGLLAWAAIVVLLEALARPRADGAPVDRRVRLGARAAIGLILLLATIGSFEGRSLARAHHRHLQAVPAALLAGRRDDELLRRIYPDPAIARERLALLEARGWSIFREGYVPPRERR